MDEPRELNLYRRVFPTWAIVIPESLVERFEEDAGYWNASDDHRMVSLTSYLMVDQRGHPIPVGDIMRTCEPMEGEHVDPPPGLDGWGVIVDTPESEVAAHAISGIIAVDGRVLMATVTCDDLEWAAEVWNSIQVHPTDTRADRAARMAELLIPATG